MPNPYYNEKRDPAYIPGYTDKPGESRRAFIAMLAAKQQAEIAAHPEQHHDLLPDASVTDIRTSIKRLPDGGLAIRVTFFLGGRLHSIGTVHSRALGEYIWRACADSECSAAD